MRFQSTFGMALMGGAGAFLIFALPRLVEPFVLVDLTVYATLAMLTMSLAFVWGYCGILSFGQSVFFGIGGYVYAVGVLNIGDSTLPIALAIALAMAFAAMLAYFMFWGRISDVYLAVITLTVSLIFFLVINSTSGGEYKIGIVSLGGYNGIPGLPPLNLPGNPDRAFDFKEMYVLTVAVALASYFLLCWTLTTRFGRVIVAIRENEVRTALLGYDPRRYKLAAYVVGAGFAGLSGALYAATGGLINPDVFDFASAAQIIVSVIIGGLGTLAGRILAVVGVQWLVAWLGKTKITDANIILGAIFVAFVLFAPAGAIPTLRKLAASWQARRRARRSKSAEGIR